MKRWECVVPLLSITRRGYTVRMVAYQDAVIGRGVVYTPFSFTVEQEGQPGGRINCVIATAGDLSILFMMRFPREPEAMAKLEFVRLDEPDSALAAFEGPIEWSDGRMVLHAEPPR